jgi:hypothetical protein
MCSYYLTCTTSKTDGSVTSFEGPNPTRFQGYSLPNALEAIVFQYSTVSSFTHAIFSDTLLDTPWLRFKAATLLYVV